MTTTETAPPTSHQLVKRWLPPTPLQERRQLIVGCRTHGEQSTAGDWHHAKIWVNSHCGPKVHAQALLEGAKPWPKTRGRA